MNDQPRGPLNLRLPQREAPTAREERAMREAQATGHLVRMLAEFTVAPTRERMARIMTALEDYQAEWIGRKSGEPR